MASLKKLTVALIASMALPAIATELPAGVITVPLIRDFNQTAYYAELQVGTPPQKEYLKIDTGSPRYSFLSSRNAVCARESQPCTTFGTFDNMTSSTCHYEGPFFQDALQAQGSGDFLNDTVSIGGVATKNMYFGYTSQYGNPARIIGNASTILGLSLECDFGSPPCIGKGPYLLPQLKNASTIHLMSTSFYLGPDDSNVTNAQMIIGNAYDKAKVDGEMFTVPMVDPYDTELSGGQTNVVNVTSIEVVLDDGNRTLATYGDEGVGAPVLLDTGAATWYLTDSIFNAVSYGLGGRGEVQAGVPYQVIDCAYRDPGHSNSHISVEFGSAGKVRLPLHSLVTKFADGTCGSFTVPRGEELTSMGDAFLRGVYIVFDQENKAVSLGQVKYTDEEEIVSFPIGGFTSG